MGYHVRVRILRSSQGKQIPISLDEALSAAKSIDGWSYYELPASFDTPSPTFVYSGTEGISATIYTFTVWYDSSPGELWTENPDDWCIEAMIVLAKRLEARVVGDREWTYDEGFAIDPNKVYCHPDDIVMMAEAEAQWEAAQLEFKTPTVAIGGYALGFLVIGIGAALLLAFVALVHIVLDFFGVDNRTVTAIASVVVGMVSLRLMIRFLRGGKFPFR
jgi:hypothetical protein